MTWMSGLFRGGAGQLVVPAISLLLFAGQARAATYSGDQLTVESFPSHTRVTVFMPEGIRYEISPDKRAGGLRLRFLSSIFKVQEVAEFIDAFDRIRRLELEDSGSSLSMVLGSKRAIENIHDHYQYFAYKKANPHRLVVDVWQTKTFARDQALAKTESDLKNKNVANRGAKYALTAKSQKKSVAGVVTAPKKKSKNQRANRKIAKAPKKENSRRVISLKRVFWGYPFIHGKNEPKDFKPGKSFPDDGFKPAAPLGTTKRDTHYKLVAKLHQDGDYALALKTINLFEKKYPKSFYQRELNFIKASCYIRLQPVVNTPEYREQALNILQSVLDYDRDDEINHRAFSYLFTEYLDRGLSQKALTYFGPWAKKDTKSASLRYKAFNGIAKLLHREGAYVNAANYFQMAARYSLNAKDRTQNSFDSMQSTSMSHLVEGNLNLAVTEIVKAKGNYPNQYKKSESAKFNIAESYFRQGKYQLALGYYDEFANKFPEHPWAAYSVLRLGEILEIQDSRLDEVETVYQSVLNRFPLSKAAQIARARLGVIEFVRRDHKKIDQDRLSFTLTQLGNIADKNHKNRVGSLARLAKGRILLGVGRTDEAYKFLRAQSAANFQGEFSKYYRDLLSGSAEANVANFIHKDDYENAISEYEKDKKTTLLKIADDNFYPNMSRAYFKVGDLVNAQKMLNLVDSKNYEGVIWQKPLKVFTKRDKRALQAEIHYHSRDVSSAVKLIKKYSLTFKTKSDFAGILGNYILGKIEYENKNWDKTIEWLEPVYSVNPKKLDPRVKEYADGAVFLASSYLEKGKFKKMQALLKPWQEFVEGTRSIASEKKDLPEDVEESLKVLFADSFWYSRKYPQAVTEYKKFLKQFPNSRQWGRVKYNQAMSLITLGDSSQGKKILQEILSSVRTPKAWKKSAEVELSLLEMDQKYLK